MKAKYLYILSLFVCSSCSGFLDIPSPEGEIPSSSIFTSEVSARAAVDGLYADIAGGNLQLLSGGLSVYGGLMADELQNPTNSATAQTFYTLGFTSTTPFIRTTFWNPAYSKIYHCNSILESLETATELPLSFRQQCMGEVRVIRGLFYFYLLQLFGPIPIATTTNYDVNANLPRQDEIDIYAFLIEELSEAVSLLSDNPPIQGVIRPGADAALALLARVYLFAEKWDKAEQTSSLVIDGGSFELEASLTNVFAQGSREAIWQLMPVGTTFTVSEGNTFIPFSDAALPLYVLTDGLLDVFVPEDLRLNRWMARNEVNDQTYTYPYKYKERGYTNPYKEYSIVLRLSEQYLIRAEARAMQDNLIGAKEDLERTRQRAGLPKLDIETTNKSALVDSIYSERQRELFAEWGHRWIDLKRSGTIDSVMTIAKPIWKPYHALLPIPSTEIEQNPSMYQNAGYEN